jgi:glycosyltransferase involved in cell wall biosynthesis
MNEQPLVSICIPAYKRLHYLERLLASIAIQTFTDYEVVVTDDSPDESVGEFIAGYKAIHNIRYYRNKATLGTPENWNEAIRLAKGSWIKLMHDDDWFANEHALHIFYKSSMKKPACSFFFSAYVNIEENSNVRKPVFLAWLGRLLLWQSPLNLFKKQYIGNPSCTFIRSRSDLIYDSHFKWVVDFEYYIRYLKKFKSYGYINKPLINVGMNEEQVTGFSFRIPEVEIPESHLLLDKLGPSALRNIFAYDYYWRLYRNLDITKVTDVQKYYTGEVHQLLVQMIRFESKIPPGVLKVGVCSKLFMSLSYILSLLKGTQRSS